MLDAKTAFLTPATGLLVRDPITREPLPPGGEIKPLDTYWCRRIADGDVHLPPVNQPVQTALKVVSTRKQTPVSGAQE